MAGVFVTRMVFVHTSRTVARLLAWLSPLGREPLALPATKKAVSALVSASGGGLTATPTTPGPRKWTGGQNTPNAVTMAVTSVG